MFYFFTAVLLGYSLLLTILIIGWRRVQSGRKGSIAKHAVSVSIVIPIRNEETGITLLLRDLVKQQVKPAEIIVLDDHSEDQSQHEVKQFIEDHPEENIILLPLVHGEGKKKAIEYGVRQARGEVIATLDGDCRVGEGWLESVGAHFTDEEVQFVFGGVSINEESTLWGAVQSMEFSSLIGVGASTMAFNFPTMCNGANLAYRREAFYQVNGYQGNDHIPSGDDEFLLRKMMAQFPRGVRFNANSEGVVKTAGLKEFRSFVHQRMRWSGKWRAHTSNGSAYLALVTFLFHLSFLACIPWVFLTGSVGAGVIYLVLKVMPELFFLKWVMKFLGARWRWTAFFTLQIFYSLYVVIFGLAAQRGAYEWKGRIIKPVQAGN